MTSAKERAVEAGARAASPHAFNDAFWLARGAPDHHQKHAQANAKNHAAAVLRAAFPILAEELVEIALKHSYSNNYFVSSDATEIAAALCARIQQMAEAL